MHPSLKGILFCLASMLSFAIQDIVTKTLLVGGLPLGELLFVRYLAFTAFAIWLARGWSTFILAIKGSNRPAMQVGRAGLSLLEIALINLSLGMMLVAKVHTLVALFPLITLLLAWLLLKEKTQLRDLVAVSIGLVGTLIVVQPGAESFDIQSLMPLSGAFALAAFSIASKFLSNKDSFITHTSYMAVTGLLISTPLALFSWISPNTEQWWLLVVLSLLNICSQLFFIKAMEYASASTLQPFNYALLLFATLFAALLLDEIPTITTLIGAGLIIIGGLISMLSSRRVRPMVN